RDDLVTGVQTCALPISRRPRAPVRAYPGFIRFSTGKPPHMPNKRPSVKNEKQYEALKDKGMSKQRAARIANSPGASSRGGKKSEVGRASCREGVEGGGR